MAQNLWSGSFRTGLAADMPTVPDFPSETFGFYFATDTGILYVGKAGVWTATRAVGSQGAPAAKADASTLTVAEIVAGLITSTSSSAVGVTLPTGTLTDAGFGNGAQPVGSYFDWSYINLGSSSGAVTLSAGTDHTIVGSAVVAISTSGRFRTRKTAANTYVTYRI